ncbi:hypothetical protein [Hoeflea sp.]|uniref:hypothetical protein n=1 Tax=Hoeflea sp. TaxID=1940281 RepID=UPI003B524AEE
MSFRSYQDVSGFSCEFPSDWSFAQAKNTDRVFTSANIPNATIIIQVIDRGITAEKTARAQLDALKAEFLNAPGGEILNEGAAPIAGQQAPYLIAQYRAVDADGKRRFFRHIQMAVAAPNVFLLMSFSAPDDIFDAHMRVFQNCSATLKIDAADPPAPPVSNTGSNGDNAETGGVMGADPEETLIWRHNDDRAFWIAIPAIWSDTIDPKEPYSVDMQHPDRVEGVIVWVVDMDAVSTVKEYADAWEEVLAKEVFFMSERLAVPEVDHPGVGLADTPVILREYQGAMNGATVRSVAGFVVNGKRGYTVVGYHFLGDREGEKRIRDAIMSFHLAAP